MPSPLVCITCFLLGMDIVAALTNSSLSANETLHNETTAQPRLHTTEDAITSTNGVDFNVTLVPAEVDATTKSSGLHSNVSSKREEKQLDLNRASCPCDLGMNYEGSCPGERRVKDISCSCRLVCARQNGQTCKADRSCDQEFGLRCDPDTFTCQGPLMVQRTEATHNSLSIRWRNSKNATVSYTSSYNGNETIWLPVESSEGTVKLASLRPNTEYYVKVEGADGREIALIKTKDGCTINETSYVGLGEVFHVGCDQTCTCMQNGKTECRERCNFRPGTISYPSCEELPDETDRCCVVYHCKDTPLPTTPKLLVTQKTPDSLTLVWDDFKSPNYESGYVVQYRSGADQNWIQVQAGNSPLQTINNLKPYTAYQIKVSVWEDEETKKLGSSSEIVTIFTEDGCEYDNMTYGVSVEFTVGCDQKCICKGSNKTECRSRCLPPYTKSGNSRPECMEVAIPDDPCCVSLNCTDKDINDVAGKSYADKIGECPDNFLVNNCTNECEHDHQCGGNEKCCRTSCGGSICLELFTMRNVCGSIACGPNAFCIPDPKFARCECESGFNGDPNDLHTGCIEAGTESYTCVYKNSTYRLGEEFDDGCDKKCRCDDDLKVKCHPQVCKTSDVKVEGRKLPEMEQPVVTDFVMTSPPTTHESITEHPVMMDKTTESSAATDRSTIMIDKVIDHVATDSGVTEQPTTEKMKEQSFTTENSTEHLMMENMTEFSMMNKASNHSDTMHEMTKSPMTVEHSTMTNATEESTTTYKTTDNYSMTEKVTEHSMTTEKMTESPPISQTDNDIMAPNVSEHVKMSGPLTTQTTMENTSGYYTTVSWPQTTTHLMDSTTDYPMLADQPVKGHRGLMNTEVPTTESVVTEEGEHDEHNDTETMHKNGPTRIKGCEFRGEIYELGQEFFDGCEAKCLCDGNGHISCVPRCPLINAIGDKCRQVADPNDSCCKIVMCDLPGDTDSVSTVEDLKIKINSAQPQNATSVTLRISASNNTSHMFQIWYAPTSNGSVDGVTWWTKMKLAKNQTKQVQNGTYEVSIHGLKPDTEYYFKMKDVASEKDTFSNVVSAKTFISAVKTAFKGCFHHNKTYESGEVFFDGCEYKCICHENGQIECRERCEVYIDTVGFENCRWGPAPDDSCCTIPFCDEKTNQTIQEGEDSVCVVEGYRSYRVGEKWEEGCTRKLCTCLLLPNGTTHVECSGGCAPIPASAQYPSPACPQPFLVTPEDPCICPYIVCNNAVSPLNVPVPMCQYKGRQYQLDEEFYDGCRAVCHCGRDLRVNCAEIECPQHFSPHINECLEWDADPSFVPTPPQCCPTPRCKNGKDGSCLMNGIRFSNFQPIPNHFLDCGTHCVCVHGNVTCENRCPHLSEFPPPNLPCPPSIAFQGRLPGDDCCLHWMCRDQERKTQHCTYHSRSYQPGEQWEVRKGALRRLCTCQVVADGQTEVDCVGGCPSIPDHYQIPTPQCQRPVLVRPEDPVMCPYVVCNNTSSAKELQNVSITALNATSIRVRFTLPSILVGLVGHAELHFTSDRTIPRSAWHVQKFARPKRLFDTPNIEYHMSGLRPDTLYFFQVRIIMSALKGGPESDTYKLRMPPISTTTTLATTPTTTTTTTTTPSTTTSSTTTTTTSTTTTTEATTIPSSPTTTTTTTTTTSLPPMIMLDAMVSIQMLDPKTAKVAWRPFESQEKRFIDGYRIKYKETGSNDDQWKVTPMIHRDVTSYILRDLEPSASYMVDLVFTTPEGLPTHLVSSSSVEMRTPEEPKDNYDFQVLLRQEKVGPYSLEVSLSGVPEPITKYVHLIRISYKSDNEEEHQNVFKVPKIQKVKLEGLKPGRRYKAWMDIYLTNGKLLSSNVIDFMTKAAPPESRAKQESSKHQEKNAEALHSSLSEDENKAYYIALIVVAIVAAVAGLGFVVLLIILLKKQSTAKAPITRNSSESAYDNPTYKTYDGERYEEKNSA